MTFTCRTRGELIIREGKKNIAGYSAALCIEETWVPWLATVAAHPGHFNFPCSTHLSYKGGGENASMYSALTQFEVIKLRGWSVTNGEFEKFFIVRNCFFFAF